LYATGGPQIERRSFLFRKGKKGGKPVSPQEGRRRLNPNKRKKEPLIKKKRERRLPMAEQYRSTRAMKRGSPLFPKERRGGKGGEKEHPEKGGKKK